MFRSPLFRHTESLASLTEALAKSQWHQSQDLVANLPLNKIESITITGCGDSHHAALCATLAFEQFTGLPCYAQSAMQLSRYSEAMFKRKRNEHVLVIGISASGEVIRTIEAIDLARKTGAHTLAISSSERSTLASVAGHLLSAATPPLSDDPTDMVIPGTRSFMASLVSLYTLAVAMGRFRDVVPADGAPNIVQELVRSGTSIQTTMRQNLAEVENLAREWKEDGEFVYCGAGPNYGTALFSAAKLLEASGDPAVGQDLEEWAHLQYFSRKPATPTIVISAGKRDVDRAAEVAAAALAIGRKLALVAPSNSDLALREDMSKRVLPTAPVRECFSPIVTCIPGLLLASEIAELKKEPYFRDFRGGRSREGGGGVSKIRTGHRLELPPE